MVSEIVKEYINSINRQDLEEMRALMSEDHEFVDGTGASYIGRDDILKGWPDYYYMFPDYTIETSNSIEDKELVAVFGFASATYKNLKDSEGSNFWRIPAAWKAIVRNNLIVYWQVYCDYTPIHKIMQRNNPSHSA
jgi:ketosteroid isomerase-like protein